MQNFDWIKLYRKFTKWEWYKDSITKSVFLHMLIIANYEDNVYRNVPLKCGELLFFEAEFCLNLGIKRQPLRTAILHLISTNEVTKRKVGKYCVISIKNYVDYQCPNQSANHELTTNQPPTNHELTTLYIAKKERIKETKNIYTGLFEEFWKAYPKKKSKPEALKAFEKIKPDEVLFNKMLSAVSAQKLTEDWQKDNGRFIPYPATWLNGQRWEDEVANVSGVNSDDVLQRAIGKVPVYKKLSESK